MIEIVPATADMIKSLVGRGTIKTVKAVAAVEGERVLGVAGVYLFDGKQIMFADFTDELRAKPRAMVKGWKILRQMVRPGITVYAEADPKIERSAEYLEHFGFEPYQERIYRWHNLPLHSQ